MNIIPGKKSPFFLLIIAISFAVIKPVEAQTYLETFGQNRIQYRKFDWRYFDTKHFRIYHYDAAGRQLARYVAEEAEREINVVEQKLGGQFPKRFNIILYNNYDEYRQTNIGLKYDAQIQDVPAGRVDLVGDKLVVYFTGKHTDLRHQIRSGMARVVMERMVFGESFRQMVKNAVLLNLPAWTTEGFIAYLVDGWTPQDNSDWENLLAAGPNTGFYELAEQYPELAGKAFWKFVSDKYGDNGIKNMLYTMELKSSLNQGMKQVLSMKVRKAYDSCIAFYKGVFAGDVLKEEQPDSAKALMEIKIPRDNTEIRSIKVSPKGSDVAYVVWKNGEYQVYIQKTQNEQQRSLVLDEGRKDYNEPNDPNYPILAWSNSGYKLAVLYKKGTQTRLRIFNSIKAKIENSVIPANRFDRVLGMTFMEDDDNIVFSAIKKSQTDLYEFRIRGSRMTSITNDAWDDIDPWFVSGGSRRGILFLSNRPKPDINVPLEVNELPTGPMNVFFYDTKTRSTELLQCTHVTTGHVTQPIQYGSDNFAYLYDSNGVVNKYVVLFGRDIHNNDSAYGVPITNYAENIVSHQYNPASNEVADVVQQGDKYEIYFKKLELPGVNAEAKKLSPTTLSQPEPEKSIVPSPINDIEKSPYRRRRYEQEQPTENYLQGGNAFQTEFQDTTTHANASKENVRINPAYKSAEPEDSTVLKEINDSTYIKLRPAPYRLSFKPDFFTIRLDNSILFSQYQSFQNNGGSFSNPPLSALATLSLNDLMENHRFTGGFQLPINFSGSTYFIEYENFSRRIDWGVLYLRTENFYNYLVTYVDNTGAPIATKQQLGKAVTNMVQGSATYPIDHVRSVRFHLALRQDKVNLKATDTLSLAYDLPNSTQYSELSRLEFVFDNTKNPALNIWNGFRYKFYVESIYGLNNGNKSCYNLGTDFRYYKKLYRNFIWAARIAAAHSDGSNEVVYYLGGVDNWINSQYSNYVPVNGGPYGFQALATNLRGYDQNARNGNTYAVFNTEFRLPVLTTFLKRPVQSSFLKNLQVIAFMDAGSAWNGFLPNAANTASNYVFPSPTNPNPNQGVNNVILNLTVPNSSGLALGYGAGIRTMLLGYFLRLDAAWNIEGIKKPIWYFSIGTDF